MKGAAQYLQPYKPKAKEGQRISNRVDESDYFDAIIRQAPNLGKEKALIKRRERQMKEFKQTWKKDDDNNFGADF